MSVLDLLSFRKREPTLDKHTETDMSREDLKRELGGTGTQIFNGILLQDDYNVDLQGGKRYQVFDRMRKSDGTVRAGLMVVKLPILSVDWYIEPASDSPEDIEIAAAIEENLLYGMTISWHDFIRHALLSLDYGSSPFEKVWEIRDNRLALRKLAPRMPSTVSEWMVDEHGGFAGIKQQNYYPTFTEVTIPSEKCLVFVNEREGSDFRGNSVLRAAYKHWYMKDRMYVVDAIAQEKRGLGVDVARVGSNITPSQRTETQSAMMALRAHQKNYLIEPEWMQYRVEGTGRGTIRDGMPSIEHHDLQILRSILAEFIAMGSGGGSLAMHKDKSSFFLMALEAVTFMLKETVNRYLIPQMVLYNWPNVKEYPELTHGRIDTRNISELSTAVAQLVSAQALHLNTDDEQVFRALLDLPELAEEDVPEPEAEQTPQTSGDGGIESEEESDEVDPGLPRTSESARRALKRFQERRIIRLRGSLRPISATGNPRTYSRRSTEPERAKAGGYPTLSKRGARVDFAAMAAGLDAGVNAIITDLGKVQNKQISKLADLGKDIVESSRGDRLESIRVPYKTELADALFTHLWELFEQGQKEVRKEFTYQNPAVVFAKPLDPGDLEKIRTYLRQKALALSGLFGDRLKSAYVWNMLGQIKDGSYSRNGVVEAMNNLSEREARKIASGTVSEALGLGRQAEAEAHESEIGDVEFSAIMDDATCGPCEAADGTEFKIGDPDLEQYKTPYQNCEGKGNCRCILIYHLER